MLRPHRRQYRLDLKGARPCTIADEVEDILALSRVTGTPALLYGHSSGAVVALETLLASPSSFAGAVIFEPPAVLAPPLGGHDGEVLQRARAAAGEGRLAGALAVFARDIAGFPPWRARIAGRLGAALPRYRRLIPCQLDDVEAIDRLGPRLGAYARIAVPVVLLGGDRSPGHLLDRLEALEGVLAPGRGVRLRGRDHGADVKAPRRVARVVAALAEEVLARG